MLNKFCKKPLYEVSFGRYIAFCVVKEYNILHFGRRRQFAT